MARMNNGKLLDGRFHSGREILGDVPSGRRAVELCGKRVKNLDPRKNYSPEEIDRKIRIMPDRCKGGEFLPDPGPYPRWPLPIPGPKRKPKPIEETSTLEIFLILLKRILW